MTKPIDLPFKLPAPLMPGARLVCQGRSLGAVAFCPVCETLKHCDAEGEFADGVHAPQCMTGPRSPYRSTGFKLTLQGDVSDPRDLLPAAPYRGQGWRRLQAHARRLQSHTAAAIFDRVKSLSVASLKLRSGQFAGREFDLAFTHWEVKGVARGLDLLSAAAWLFGINPGIVAARLLEAVSGADFDARAFLEIAAAVDKWQDRGAPRGEGLGP